MSAHSALLGDLTPQQFIDSVWQQTPLLVRNALPEAAQLVDGNDLAGIACEDNSDARLVITTPSQDHWQCEAGPFTAKRFTSLPTSHWTLLVQSVDHWIPEVQALLQHFTFLPRWRLDDIMISYAVDGGGVGPHFDYYDVFLIQASGQRRWQTGQRCDETTPLHEDAPLRLLQDFYTETEAVLSPGDMLYVPAGVSHCGTAIGDDCITISIGFRAASHRELLQAALENIAETLPANMRYTDTPAAIAQDTFCINKHAIEQLLTYWDALPRDTIRTALVDALGELSTELHRHEDIAPDKKWTLKQLQKKLQTPKGLQVEHHPVSRFSYRLTETGAASLYVDGGTLHTTETLAKAVCHGHITYAVCPTEHEQQLILALLNQGSLIAI